MLTPPKRQSRAIMADSLFPKDRKKQETQDITLEPAGAREEESSMSVATMKATHSPLCPFDRDETLWQGTPKEGFSLSSNLTYIVFYFNSISSNHSLVQAMHQTTGWFTHIINKSAS